MLREIHVVLLKNRNNLCLALKAYSNCCYAQRRLIKYVHRNHQFSLNNENSLFIVTKLLVKMEFYILSK